ncbi:MAG: MotA/TolQ/ExbB proton channel family protein [Planctomycetota bacterium]
MFGPLGDHLSRFWELLRDQTRQALEIWEKGGWAMFALATVALVLFAVGFHVLARLRGKRFTSVPEDTWRRWVLRPTERMGTIGDLLDFATSGDTEDVKETAGRFHELQLKEIGPFDRDLKVMKVCVSAAPLVGLLGTVTGMLTTFSALSAGSGGDQTLDKIATGISEALITTETGLVIALPGLFFQWILARKLNRYKAFLTHLETVSMQALYRQIDARQKETVTRQAQAEIARALRIRLKQAPTHAR